MKKLFFALIFSVVAYSGFSQDSLAATGHHKSTALVKRLARELSLDKNQQDRVYTALQKRWTSLAKTKTDKQMVDHAKLNQKTTADLKKILSKEQFDLFIKLKDERKKEKESFAQQNPAYVFSEEDRDMEL